MAQTMPMTITTEIMVTTIMAIIMLAITTMAMLPIMAQTTERIMVLTMVLPVITEIRRMTEQ